MKKITLAIAMFIAVISMKAQETVWEDSFESYDDFAISDIGDWTQIDNDGDSTYGIADTEFENSGYTGTGIVFNPTSTTPPLTGGGYDAHTGDKGLYFFTSTGDVSGAPGNDDYFISPQIDLTNATESQLTFWAKTLTEQYGLEEFEILLSTTGTDEADFTINLSEGIVEAPITYTKYTYDLAAYDGQQVYFAVHYVSEDTFVLQMDDFRVGQEVTAGLDDVSVADFSYYKDAQNKMHLKSSNVMEKLSVYSILGKEVKSQNLNLTETTVDLSNLSSGVYIMQVQIDGQSKSFKFVK